MIKAVFFDIDDTLYDFRDNHKAGMEAIANYLYGQTGTKREDTLDAIARAQEKIGKRLGFNHPSFHNRQIRFQNALEILGLPVYPYANEMYGIYWEVLNGGAVPEPGLLSLLQLLKKKNIHIGTGTDMTSYIQNRKLERMGIAKYFDSVVTSEEAGWDKPDKGIFLLCLEKANCNPDEAIFIGDVLEKDIAGAHGVGMHAACYRRYSKETRMDEAWCIDSYLDCVVDGEVHIGDLVF